MNPQQDPQDQKNLFAAVILSLLVLMGWQYFFAQPKLRQEQARKEYSKEVEAQRAGTEPQGPPGVAAPVAPSAATATPAGQPPQAIVSRDEALKLSPRLAIKTPSLEGSIALKGGLFDDLVLAKYRETIDPKSPPVPVLSPVGTEHPYYAEFGWSASDAALKMPGPDSVWSTDQKTLEPGKPAHMVWDNGQGLVFALDVAIDEQFM